MSHSLLTHRRSLHAVASAALAFFAPRAFTFALVLCRRGSGVLSFVCVLWRSALVEVGARSTRANNALRRTNTNRCTRPPTALRFARSSLHSGLPAAGELSRCAAALTEWSRGGSTLVAERCLRWMRVLASALLGLEVAGSGAAFWFSCRAAFRLACGFLALGRRGAFALVQLLGFGS